MDLQRTLVGAACVVGSVFFLRAWLTWIHKRYVDPLPFPNKELAHEVHQTRVVRIDCPPDEAILAARDAVLALRKSKLLRMAGRKVEARTGMSMRSMGETIVVSAEPADPGESRLFIESRPRSSGTTMDQGKGYENVERIFAHLAARHAVSLVSANASA